MTLMQKKKNIFAIFISYVSHIRKKNQKLSHIVQIYTKKNIKLLFN